MAYSFNRCRTAAIKTISAMQERLQNIGADFDDVDMFLVTQADECVDRLEDFKQQLALAEDPFDGAREMRGVTMKKVRVRRMSKKVKLLPPETRTAASEPGLFDGIL
jgi:hypothetical protein